MTNSDKKNRLSRKEKEEAIMKALVKETGMATPEQERDFIAEAKRINLINETASR